mgnify:CR=1 FL=1
MSKNVSMSSNFDDGAIDSDNDIDNVDNGNDNERDLEIDDEVKSVDDDDNDCNAGVMAMLLAPMINKVMALLIVMRQWWWSKIYGKVDCNDYDGDDDVAFVLALPTKCSIAEYI